MKTRMVVLWLSFFLAVALLGREKNDVIIMRNGDRITYSASFGVAWKFGDY